MVRVSLNPAEPMIAVKSPQNPRPYDRFHQLAILG